MDGLPSQPTGYFAHQASELALSISLTLISILAVGLRLFARVRSHSDIALDDWLIVAALLIFLGTLGVAFWNASQGGYGYDPTTLPIPLLEVTLKFYFLAGVMTLLVITCAKLSVLCLYHRVFVTNTFRRWTFVMGVICLVWAIAAVIAVIFKCTPISASWKIPSVGRCISYSYLVAVVEALNCLQDLVIVCMPIGVIRRLQLPLKKKILLGVVFLLGGFIIITSIIRIVYVWRYEESDVSFINSARWALIQLASIIVAACLPTYGTLLRKRRLPVHPSLYWPSNRNQQRIVPSSGHTTLFEDYTEDRSLPSIQVHGSDDMASPPIKLYPIVQTTACNERLGGTDVEEEPRPNIGAEANEQASKSPKGTC